MFDSNGFLNVDDHFPGKEVRTDHTFVVCREKRKQGIKAYTGRDMRECPSIQGIQISVTYLCIKPEGTCLQVFTKKCSFGCDTFHTIGFPECSSKNMNI